MKKKNIIILLIFFCIFAIIASLIASGYPDGLEWVAEKLGFLEQGEGKELISAPIPDYQIPWVKKPFIAGGIAALIGTLITFIVAYALGKIVAKSKK